MGTNTAGGEEEISGKKEKKKQKHKLCDRAHKGQCSEVHEFAGITLVQASHSGIVATVELNRISVARSVV